MVIVATDGLFVRWLFVSSLVCRLNMKILVFLLHLITRVETRKLAPVDLAIIFEESGDVLDYNFDNFHDMMDLAFDMEATFLEIMSIYTVCDGQQRARIGWATCSYGGHLHFQKNFGTSMATVNKEFFGNAYDRPGVTNMLFIVTTGMLTELFTEKQILESENIVTNMTNNGVMVFVFRWVPQPSDGVTDPDLGLLSDDDVAIIEKIIKDPSHSIYMLFPWNITVERFQKEVCDKKVPSCEAKPKGKTAKCRRDFIGGCYPASFGTCNESECECDKMYRWDVSQCSVTCGIGIKTFTRDVLPGSLCETSKTESCTMGTCSGVATSSVTEKITTTTTAVPTTTTTTPAVTTTTTTTTPTTTTTTKTTTTTTTTPTTTTTTTTPTSTTTTTTPTTTMTTPTTTTTTPTSTTTTTTTTPTTTTTTTITPTTTTKTTTTSSKTIDAITAASMTMTPTTVAITAPSAASETSTQKESEHQTTSSESTMIIIALAVGGVLLVIVIVAIVLVMFCRKGAKKRPVAKKAFAHPVKAKHGEVHTSADLSSYMKDDHEPSVVSSPSSSMVKGGSVLSKSSPSKTKSLHSKMAGVALVKGKHGVSALGAGSKSPAKGRSGPSSPSSSMVKGGEASKSVSSKKKTVGKATVVQLAPSKPGTGGDGSLKKVAKESKSSGTISPVTKKATDGKMASVHAKDMSKSSVVVSPSSAMTKSSSHVSKGSPSSAVASGGKSSKTPGKVSNVGVKLAKLPGPKNVSTKSSKSARSLMKEFKSAKSVSTKKGVKPNK